MPALNFLYKKEYKINNSIKIIIPSVGDVLENEDNYYSIVTSLTAMPIDFMVQLEDMGIDFTKIGEFELFVILFQSIKDLDTSLVFGDLDLNKFELSVNEENGNLVLHDAENNIVIDKAIQNQISQALRKIHGFEKNRKKPANEEAKEYLLKRERKKQARAKKRKLDSQLESLIVAMVNSSEFKYNYEEVKNISIYQFNKSIRQVIKRVDFDKRMIGVYAGTINTKDMKTEDFNWLCTS